MDLKEVFHNLPVWVKAMLIKAKRLHWEAAQLARIRLQSLNLRNKFKDSLDNIFKGLKEALENKRKHKKEQINKSGLETIHWRTSYK